MPFSARVQTVSVVQSLVVRPSNKEVRCHDRLTDTEVVESV